VLEDLNIFFCVDDTLHQKRSDMIYMKCVPYLKKIKKTFTILSDVSQPLHSTDFILVHIRQNEPRFTFAF
jgi:hypothetical protein